MSVDELFDALYGNAELKSKLISDIESGRFIHTCIIEGGKGTGKHTLANLISAALQINITHREKVLKGISPDVSIIGLKGDRKTIGIETVRDIIADAHIKPNESNIKIYIIEDTHTMTTQAQNAFLKLLEEPPANVYFILLCENTSALLTTVKSRAVIYKTQVFNDNEIRSYITANHKKVTDIDYIIKSANGSIGAVLDNLSAKKSEKNKEKYIKIKNLLQFISEKNTAEVLLNNNIPDKRDEIIEFIDKLMSAVRDVTAYKFNAGDVYEFFIDNDEITLIADKIAVNDLLKIYDILNEFKRKIETNVNIHNAKIMLLNRLLKE